MEHSDAVTISFTQQHRCVNYNLSYHICFDS